MIEILVMNAIRSSAIITISDCMIDFFEKMLYVHVCDGIHTAFAIRMPWSQLIYLVTIDVLYIHTTK